MLRLVFGRASFWGLACQFCGKTHGWKVSNCYLRTNSCVALAACKSCGKEQFLKKYYRPGPASATACAAEYDVLSRFTGNHAKATSLLVPDAYQYCAASGAFSMQYLYGETLAQRFQKAPGPKVLRECMEAAARWLRALHDSPVTDQAEGNGYQTMMGHIDQHCQALMEKDIAGHAAARMRALVPDMHQRPGVRVPLHGDFKPSNLIWTLHGVYGVDVSMRYANPAGMDIAQFFGDLLLTQAETPLIANGTDFATLLHIFLDAYGDRSEEQERRVVWWLLYFLLTRWRNSLPRWRSARAVDALYGQAITTVMSGR